MGDHHNFLAAGLVLIVGEGSAERRLDAEDLEVGRGYKTHPERSRLAAAGVAQGTAGLCRHRFERLALPAPIQVIRRRNGITRVVRRFLIYLDDALGLRITSALEKHSVHHAE